MKKSIRLFLLMLTVALLIAAACYLSFKAAEQSIIEENEAAVHNMAQSLLPALMVGDAQQIDSLLKTLASNPGIQSAELISGTGIPLAAYVREGIAVDPAQSQFALASAEGGRNAYELRVVAPLTFDTQIFANLHVAVNLWPAYLRVIQILGVLLIVPSVFYVLVKQLRLKIRVERAAFGGGSGSDGQFDIDNALQEALKDAEISLEYQPIKRLSDNGIFGAEVVVCWKHPSGQTLHVSPADFIALAESSGLFLPFGAWVLETATLQVAAWQSQHGPLVLALNIAPSQLKDPDFYQKVRSACVAGQYPHQLLEFEINETALVRHTTALEDVRAFMKQGMSLTVDGFGLSSRSQDLLHSLAIQKVKFDPKLIKNIANDPEMLAFVGSMADLAASLDIQVMADGLRSQEQTDHMLKLGCILGQGPHQSQPLSPKQFEAMLVNQGRGEPVVVATTQTGVVGNTLSY
jgi:EAL domain-containing protein (putative c-di-GMP-specific phosphodiesterase class I)